MLRGQSKPEAALAAFRDFIRLSPLAARNARFDLSFLHSSQQRSRARGRSSRDVHRLTVD
jgi:DNA polymerase III epsilon subunit-like protein